MASSKSLIAIVATAVLVVGGAYYLYSTGAPSNSVEVHIAIRGDGTDFFDPANLTVKQGQVVTLAVFNNDDNTHGLVIPGLNVDSGIIQGGTTVRIVFTADRVGVFPFSSPPSYCGGGRGNVCNSAQNLIGTLTVQA